MPSDQADYRESYERIARDYAGDEPREDDPRMRAHTRALFIERLQGKRILEVGCGPGTDSQAFVEAGLSVTAIDYSQEFVNVVRERYPDVDARRMDMTDLDGLGELTFDGIYGFASFVHLPRDSAGPTLQGFLRRLKPGGLLYLTLIASSKLREYVIPDWGGQPDNPMLFVCYDEDEAEALAREVGFLDIEILRVPSPIYEEMPRLVERGVRTYHLTGRSPARSPGP